MILRKLSILNYKNIRSAELRFSPKFNCFVGMNGVGKTNILDAIYYLSSCRSIFNLPDSHLITHDESFFVLDAEYATDGGEPEMLYCGLKKGTKKHFKRNGKEYKRLSQHIGHVPVVLVSPSDSVIIDGGSEERRRLLDVVISQYDNTYLDTLANYSRLLQQRNTLLKQEEEPDANLLDIIDMQMAETGKTLYVRRKEYVERLEPLFQQAYDAVSGSRERVSLSYISHCQRGDLLDILRESRAKDRVMGYSLHGVHRDDLDMSIAGYPIKKEGSQGQCKTYTIALKIAQFQFLRKTNLSNTPLLLLDDIFDKLDAKRVSHIVRLVSGNDYGQIFITDTNRERLDEILKSGDFDYKIFNIEDGMVCLKEESQESHV